MPFGPSQLPDAVARLKAMLIGSERLTDALGATMLVIAKSCAAISLEPLRLNAG